MPADTGARTVTPERAARLHRLLRFLATGPKTRSAIMRRLRLDVRGFYRDLELLRASAIDLILEAGRYSLGEDAGRLIKRLPFPDPHLRLGEAEQLSRGRSAAHRKLKEQMAEIVR